MSLVNSIKNTNEEIGQIDSQKPLTVPAQCPFMFIKATPRT